MRRKEALFAVIGGVVGAVLVMAASLLSPLGAQNEVRDGEFGTITCRELLVEHNSDSVGDLGTEIVAITQITPTYIMIGLEEKGGRSALLTASGVGGVRRRW